MQRNQIQERFMTPTLRQTQLSNQGNNDNMNYEYAYSVNDKLTGDFKTQTEHRRGHYVQGQYSLIDADGFQRIVDYTANDRDGLHSEVRRLPLNYRWNNNNNQLVYVSNNNLNRFGIPILSAVSNILVPTAYSSVTRHDGLGSLNTLIKY